VRRIQVLLFLYDIREQKRWVLPSALPRKKMTHPVSSEISLKKGYDKRYIASDYENS
jgi:hypothetical protein